MSEPIKKKSPIRIWLAGGGTGGHIIPLLAVAEVLQKDSLIHITYIGDANGPEKKLARQMNIPFIAIPSGKLRRYVSFTSILFNFRDVFLLVFGIIKSFNLIKRKKPSIIFSKGGGVALPVAIAAWLAKVPLITHESDAVLGATNRIISRFAKVVLTAFPATVYPPRYAKKITSVGLPIRAQFCRSQKTNYSRRPMVFVTGGSQGAVAINEAIVSILPELLKDASVMHVTGEYSYTKYLQAKDLLPAQLAQYYAVVDYLPNNVEYMREATVVVSRASSTIFELASLGKPMILIPLPSAANNHQQKNAEFFVNNHAAIMLIQDNLTPKLLYETITAVIDDRNLREKLGQHARQFASCDAAKRVAEILKYHARN